MRVTPAAFSHNGQSPAACATRSRLGPLRSAERFRPAASLGAHTGNRVGGEQRLVGNQARPGAVAELDAAAPVLAERGCDAARGDAHLDVGFVLPKSASRGISQRIAKVGPTPMVSTRTLGGAVTCAVRLASASKIGVSPP
jgi:hypothetical protein